MTTLTNAELGEPLETAQAAADEPSAAPDHLQVESTLAGEKPGEVEREAEAALAAAATQAEYADNLTVENLANVQKLSTKLSAAIEGYVRAYEGLVRGVTTAQQFINENRRLASDTWLPRPDALTREEIGRLATQGSQPPGSAFHAAQDPDVSRIEPLVDRYSSYARFFREQLAGQRTASLAG